MPLTYPTLFYQLLGPYSTRAQIVAYPGLTVNGGGSGYVTRFETPLGQPKKGFPYVWATYGVGDLGNLGAPGDGAAAQGQYSSGAMCYAWYAMTGIEDYLTKANAYVVAYRDAYLIANGYGIQPHLLDARGLALHYAATGDETSRTALGGLAKFMANDNTTNASWLIKIRNNTSDQRHWIRALEAMLYAGYINVPDVVSGFAGAYGPYNYSALATQALGDILARQFPDGRWCSTESYLLISYTDVNDASTAVFSSTLVSQPWYTHILWNGLSDYYRLHTADARIWPAIAACATYHFENTDYGPSYTGPGSGGNNPDFATGIWNPIINNESCYYSEANKGWYNGVNFGELNIKYPGPQNALNGFMLPCVAELYSKTGNPIWKTRADHILNGIQGWDYDNLPVKQIGEIYSWSYRAFPYLLGTPATPVSAGGLPDADITLGGWKNEAGGTALAPSIGEATPNNATYIYSGTGANDICEVSLSDPAGAIANGPIKYRYGKKLNNGVVVNLRVRLMQGTTEIAHWDHADIPFAPADATQALTAPQFAAITTPANLRLQFVRDAP